MTSSSIASLSSFSGPPCCTPLKYEKDALTIEDVLGVAQVVHEDLCDLPVMHGDHKGQVGELTRLGPRDEGGEDVLEGDRVLGLKGTLVNLA